MDSDAFIIGLLAALIIVFIILSIKTVLDKKRITNYYTEKKYNVYKITKDAFFLGMFSSSGDDFYHVVLINKNGKYSLKTCKTDILSGIKEFASTDKTLCKNCHSIVDTYYTECPNCRTTL
jgi:hypothetical protein